MADSKQNILLLHGALGSKEIFEDLIPYLSEKFNVYSFDFYGHGIYSNQSNINVEMLCKQIEDYVENRQLQGISVFGYSMGGYLALFASYRKPDYLGKIITLGTKFEWNVSIADRETNQLRSLLKLPDEHPFKKQLISLHGEINYKNCLKNTREIILEIGGKNFLTDANAEKINSEILLLLGENDNMVSKEETIQISKHLPNSNLIVLTDTKHQFEKVNKASLSEIINKFLLN